jgi:hypothetical protein
MRQNLEPLFCFLLLAAALPAAADTNTEKMVWSGTMDIDQTRVSFIGSANGGGGTLHFRGKDYPFSTGGLGIGGIGVTRLKATGTVYNLNDPAKFPGTYGELRTGITVGKGSGQLWLRNADGVILELKGEGEGAGLNLGADAVQISFK